MRRALTLMVILLVCVPAFAQAPAATSADATKRADSYIGKMSPEQKIDYIGGTGFAIRAVPELGLPALQMSDGPFGVRSNERFPSTTYAVGINLAASWDIDLAEKAGAGIGKDARARGIHFMLGPGVNIYRSALNGRNFEYFRGRPVPDVFDRSRVHQGHAVARSFGDDQALPGQQLRVSCGTIRIR